MAAVMLPKKVRIKVKKWETYNPRKDVHKTIWFRLQNDLLENPRFEHFSCEEIVTFIYILSQCSKAQCDEVIVNLVLLREHRRVSIKSAWEGIFKLEALEVVEVIDDPLLNGVTRTSHGRNTDVTDAGRLRDAAVTAASHGRTSTNERTNVKTGNQEVLDPSPKNSISPVAVVPSNSIELVPLGGPPDPGDNSIKRVDNSENGVDIFPALVDRRTGEPLRFERVA
jgi:hypothetical protein